MVFYFYFGGVANRRSCGSEVGRSMSQGKVRDYPLHTVL